MVGVVFDRKPVLFFAATFAAVACQNDSRVGRGEAGQGTVLVALTDGPVADGTITEVSVCIRRIDFVFADDQPIARLAVERTIDLLALRGGLTTALGVAQLPVGLIQQVRLVLCPDGSSIVADGAPIPLKIPSGEQTGVKLTFPGGFEVRDNVTTTVILDFDADKSLHFTDGEGWILTPMVQLVESAIVLVITSPLPGDTVPLALTVRGTVASREPLADLTVNGLPASVSGVDWEAEVLLRPESATATITTRAVDIVGRVAEVAITVLPEGLVLEAASQERLAGVFLHAGVGIRFLVTREINSSPEGTIQVTSIEGAPLWSVDFMFGQHEAHAVLLGGRLVLSRPATGESGNITLAGEEGALWELLATPEYALLPLLSRTLGVVYDVTGTSFPISLPLHMAGLGAEALRPDAPTSEAIIDQEPAAANAAADAVCQDLRGDPNGDNCLGMCGRRCSCRDEVCGNCCCNVNCLYHDERCAECGFTAPLACVECAFFLPLAVGCGSCGVVEPPSRDRGPCDLPDGRSCGVFVCGDRLPGGELPVQEFCCFSGRCEPCGPCAAELP